MLCLSFSVLIPTKQAAAGFPQYLQCSATGIFDQQVDGSLTDTFLSDATLFTIDTDSGQTSYHIPGRSAVFVITPFSEDYPLQTTQVDNLEPYQAIHYLIIQTKYSEARLFPYVHVGGAGRAVTTGVCRPLND